MCLMMIVIVICSWKAKGSLRKEDQQFGEWLPAEVDLTFQKTSILVPDLRPHYTGPAQTQRASNPP